jgi:hypothetical protein
MLCNVLLQKGDGEHDYTSKRYKKIQTTKKLGCRATVVIFETVSFPQFAVRFLKYFIFRLPVQK